MTEDARSPRPNPEEPTPQREPWTTWLKVFFLIEASAAMIGLILPITPSKTGSDKDLSEWILEDPPYWQQALFDFVFVNLLFVVFGLAAWAYTVWQRRRGASDRS